MPGSEIIQLNLKHISNWFQKPSGAHEINRECLLNLSTLRCATVERLMELSPRNCGSG